MTISVGQIFAPAIWHGARARMTNWQVVGLFDGCDGIRHAKLIALGNPVECRTVSCAALADRRLYRRVSAVTLDAAE